MNITKAVHGLDIFRKNWCWDNELDISNCDFCEFRKENNTCSLKNFAYGHEHDYPMEKFILVNK